VLASGVRRQWISLSGQLLEPGLDLLRLMSSPDAPTLPGLDGMQ
jgi:hypothetical protein